MGNRPDLAELMQDYAGKREEIRKRLQEFREVSQKGDDAIFRELCFCILAANSSSVMAQKTLAVLDDLLLTGTAEEMQRRLSGGVDGKGFRYWRRRPEYIVHTRKYLQKGLGLKITDLIETLKKDRDSLRDFFARNKGIKGIGYKEASHFLRNVGFPGYAILDKHILSCLKEFGVIRSSRPPKNPRQYRSIERKMGDFSHRVGVTIDELDLLLWSRKTGMILK